MDHGSWTHFWATHPKIQQFVLTINTLPFELGMMNLNGDFQNIEMERILTKKKEAINRESKKAINGA